MENTKPFRDTDYFVNEKGECFRKGKKLNPYPNTKGYLKICVYQNGKRIGQFAVHRMVAELFIPNPDNLPQINHKDGNKKNNNIENLEWCDQSHNMKHAVTELGFNFDTNCRLTKIPAEEIKKLRLRKQMGETLNVREIAEKWGLDRKYMGKIINGKQRVRV